MVPTPYRILGIEILAGAALVFFLLSPLRFPLALAVLFGIRLLPGLMGWRPSRDSFRAAIAMLLLVLVFFVLRQSGLAEKSAWAFFVTLAAAFLASCKEEA